MIEELELKYKPLVIVCDANVFIHYLEIVEEVLQSGELYDLPASVVLPYQVFRELEDKKQNGDPEIAERAGYAIQSINQAQKNPGICYLSLQTSAKHGVKVRPYILLERNNDYILNCALQEKEFYKDERIVILLTEDLGLQIAGRMEHVISDSPVSIKSWDKKSRSINMEPAGLLSLPVEVIHHLAKFLSVEDILACSASCHFLREVFNNNILWKKYLPEQFTLDLQNQVNVLEPTFCLEDRLPPLCENRVAFIKKTSIVKNWKNAKYKKYSTKKYSSLFNVFKVKGQAIYKDRYLFLGPFINDDESNAIEVWDIIEKPALLMHLKMDKLLLESFYIVGDNLVVVECVQVKVYAIKISEKSMPLLYSFLITDNEIVLHGPVNHPTHDSKCIGWIHSVVDHYFFANLGENEDNYTPFHIWDIAKASKVGSFLPPMKGCSIAYQFRISCNWILRMVMYSGEELYYFQFNIEKKSFSDSVLKVNIRVIHSMIYKSCLIFFKMSDSAGMSESIICTVYDLNTSQKIKERNLGKVTTRSYEVTSTKVMNGQFVMLFSDGFHVFDAVTLNTLQRFDSNNLRFLTHHFNILGSIFIVCANNHNKFEVWDLNKKKKSPIVLNGLNGHLYLSSSCDKLACIYYFGIDVYNFL